MEDKEQPEVRKKPSRKAEPPSSRGIAWPRWTGFRGMTVRDWLQLLIVPFALVVISFVFTMQQEGRQQRIEDQRAKREREIEEQRAHDAALQAYVDQMGQMLLDKDRPLRQSKEGDEVRTLARARTVTIFRRLDAARNRDVLQFLREARLTTSPTEHDPIFVIRLDYTNLSEAELRGANLDSFDLQGTDLSGADLRGAYLAWSLLHKTNLQGANLQSANLSGDTDLSQADLSQADLSDANLQGATLSEADLRGANLGNAKVTDEQLEEAASLKGATMPNGQKYEDWLKDHEEENNSP